MPIDSRRELERQMNQQKRLLPVRWVGDYCIFAMRPRALRAKTRKCIAVSGVDYPFTAQVEKVLGNRIHSPGVPGVATKNSLQSKISAFDGTIFFNRLRGVIGATWIKATALAQKRADCVLITANQNQQQFHGLRPIVRIRSSKPRTSSLKVRRSNGRGGLQASRTIKSRAGKSACCLRKTSRTKRRSRFRSTDRRRKRLATTSPKRATASDSPSRGR